MTKIIKLGFAGVGSMGQCAHLKNYCALPDCEVVAIAELREKTAREVARRYDVPKVYPDAAGMLAGEELDAVVASQPFNRHGILVPELLKAGKPVFIEKPLASTLTSGEAILRAVEASGTWIMVGYNKRSDPGCAYARERVEEFRASGELGALRYVRATMPPGDWIASGFADRIDAGDPRPELDSEPPAGDMDEATFKAYTAFVNYYIHQVNLIRFFLGESYRVVYADPSGVTLAGVSAGGVACLLEMAPYNTTLGWQETLLVAFERGYVKVEIPAPLAANRAARVEILRDPGGGRAPETLHPEMPPVGSMQQQAANFLATVKGERGPTCDAAEALEDLRIAREYLRLWKGK